MATIVEFKCTSRREPTLADKMNGPADIVFFPGVRYERHPEPDATKPNMTKRSRDTLKLEG
ncbi:hypothetical protein [Hyphomicrobium sp.]|jgi:hypothetical protein|uniref:hypothetical protein n=1 Tax=Hyphomicrobium sp. TaxID=82 RepID=UPI002CBD7CD8|nr:hypothetical protein [Hyphomicrobium sp.]HVZ05123.1 hypothetical protein [Hyphomicrobium sp.]